jgi:hypothetical protein
LKGWVKDPQRGYNSGKANVSQLDVVVHKAANGRQLALGLTANDAHDLQWTNHWPLRLIMISP